MATSLTDWRTALPVLSSAPRAQSPAEELANALSHGLGLVLAAAAMPLLVQMSLRRAASWQHTAAVGVFATTMLLLYLASTLFHASRPGQGKHLFARLDHAAIYLFIAGSYTAFAASTSAGRQAGWQLGVVWLLALAGAVVTWFDLIRRPGWSVALYLIVGWAVLIAALPWIAKVSVSGTRLLVAGGLAYTLGTPLFLLGQHLRFAHFFWHLCVMAGSGLHVAALLCPA